MATNTGDFLFAKMIINIMNKINFHLKVLCNLTTIGDKISG